MVLESNAMDIVPCNNLGPSTANNLDNNVIENDVTENSVAANSVAENNVAVKDVVENNVPDNNVVENSDSTVATDSNLVKENTFIFNESSETIGELSSQSSVTDESKSILDSPSPLEREESGDGLETVTHKRAGRAPKRVYAPSGAALQIADSKRSKAVVTTPKKIGK